jgi:hypothetical protein
MSTIPPLDAIKKYTGEYVYAAVANKTDEYVCPDCSRDLILKKGNIRIQPIDRAFVLLFTSYIPSIICI